MQATANTAAPAPGTMPATRARVADGEVDVRLGQRLSPDFGEHGLGDRELPGRRRGAADQDEQHDGARVAAPVHEMAEARYLLTAPQQFAHLCRAKPRVGPDLLVTIGVRAHSPDLPVNGLGARLAGASGAQ